MQLMREIDVHGKKTGAAAVAIKKQAYLNHWNSFLVLNENDDIERDILISRTCQSNLVC